MKKLTKDIFEEGVDGNAFAIMGAFSKQARRDGWSEQERNEILEEAKSGDYDHLIQTIMAVCPE